MKEMNLRRAEIERMVSCFLRKEYLQAMLQKSHSPMFLFGNIGG